MTLQEHIDEIRNGLRGGAFINEASVSQGIVLRLLDELSWPRYDMQVIIPEYSVEGRRVDYALCHPPSNPLVFIEVKQVGQIEGAERQLFEYAFDTKVPIAILTDGRKWHFFHPTGQGDYRERLVFQLVYQLDLIETDSGESTERLNRYLNYDLIRNGEAIEAIKDDYRVISQQRHIEEAWSELLELESRLVRLVGKEVENLYGYTPTGEQVLDFLKSLEKADLPPPPPPPPLLRGNLVITMPDGDIIKHPKAVDTFVEVIERLGIEDVADAYPKLVSTSEFPIGNRKVGQYNVNTHSSTKQKKQQLERIAERFGIQLKVDIVPKVSN